MTQVPGWVAGMSVGSLPSTSPPGPGAAAGYWLNKAAEGEACESIPEALPYLQQTGYCEYSKLVCRLNFQSCADKAQYKPTEENENVKTTRQQV